jgi:hypothetical protein
MNSTKPTTSADPAFTEVLRNAAGLGLCAVALVMAALSAQRGGDRLALLDAVAAVEEAQAVGSPQDQERLIARGAENLRGLADRRPADPSASAAFARVRLLQASRAAAAPDALLAEAASYAAKAAKAGGAGADIAMLRAQIALAAGPSEEANAAGFVAQSYAARGMDARLAPVRARLGLRLWADLPAPAQALAQAETCLLLRTAPTLAPALAAAAVEAHAPLLPSDFEAWTQDPACAPGA